MNSFKEIQSIPFFQKFPTAMLEQLVQFIEIKKFRSQEALLLEGGTNHCLYFIQSGRIGVYVKGEPVAHLQQKGSILGEMSLFNGNKISASVISESAGELLFIDLTKIQKEAPSISSHFENNKFEIFTEIITARLIETNEKARLFEKANKELLNAKKELEKMNSVLEKRVLERISELREKNASLEVAVSNNKQLVRVLCHDLNNALSIIKAAAAIAFFKKTSGEDEILWQRVKKAADKESDLIRYVKDCLALESGKLKLKLTPVKVIEIIESARFIFHDRLEMKNLSFDVQIPEELMVLAEPVSLSNSVFNNLISNAIKFTPHGKKISIQFITSEKNKVVIEVRDQGIGIPEKVLKDLFSLTSATSRAGTEGETGTGFGMPLVKTHMDAYGAEIQVDSKEGQGTSFILKFQKPT